MQVSGAKTLKAGEQAISNTQGVAQATVEDSERSLNWMSAELGKPATR